MRKEFLRRAAAVLAGVVMVSSVSACGSAKQSDVTLKVGDIKALGTVAPFVAQDLGYFEKEGVKVEFGEFADGTALMEAFAAGEIDIAICGVAPVANWYTKGADLQVVAAANGGGHVIVTRSDTGITSVDDLKGKVLAEPNLGTVTDTLLRDYILKNAGIDPEKDLTILPGLKPADMATSLFDTREVDAILTWEPFVAQAQEKYGDDCVILYNSPNEIKADRGSDVFYAVNVVAASGNAIKNKTDALKRFLTAYKNTVDYLNTDPAANAAIARQLEMDESIVAAARNNIDYNYNIDPDNTNATLQWALDLGYIDAIPDAAEFFTEVK